MKRVLAITIFILYFVINSAYAIDYSSFDINDINSVKKATQAYQKNYKNREGTKAAKESYDAFRKFYIDFLEKHRPLIEKECNDLYYSGKFHKYNKKGNPYMISLPKVAYELGKKYEKYGFTILFDEDFFYPSISFKYLYNNFAPYLPNEDKILMKFDMEHFDKTWISDNHYVVKKEEIITVLNFYRKFQKKYPKYSKEHMLSDTIKEYEIALRHYPIAAYNFNDNNDVTDCFRYFELYDKYGLNAINKAVQGFQKEFDNIRGTEKADSGYYEFYLFYTKFCETLEKKIEKEYKEYINNKKNYNYYKTGIGYINGNLRISITKIADIFSKKYQKYGIKIIENNGKLEPFVDYKYIYDNISPYLSKTQQEEIKSYLK